MNKIREYTANDFIDVTKWCVASNIIPSPASVFSNTSFVVEIDNVPALFISLYLTNSQDIAYLDNLIGNPSLKGAKRKKATKQLFEYVAEYAKQKGYSRIVIAANEKLASYYSSFGYSVVNKNLTRIMRTL